jgi:hypothetical protein
MSKRISELTQFTGTLSGQELVEISVPNNGSDTGYITRSVEVSKFMGSGGSTPYRYEIPEQTINFDSDYTFKLTFDKSLFYDTSMFPNGPKSGAPYPLALGMFNFNAAVALNFQTSGEYVFESFGFINSNVLIPLGNQNSGSGGNSDQGLGRIGTFNSGNDGQITSVAPDNYPLTNAMYSTPLIQPINFYEEWSGSPGDGPAPDQIVFVFQITGPYNVFYNPSQLIIKGYVDANTIMSGFRVPS